MCFCPRVFLVWLLSSVFCLFAFSWTCLNYLWVHHLFHKYSTQPLCLRWVQNPVLSVSGTFVSLQHSAAVVVNKQSLICYIYTVSITQSFLSCSISARWSVCCNIAYVWKDMEWLLTSRIYLVNGGTLFPSRRSACFYWLPVGAEDWLPRPSVVLFADIHKVLVFWFSNCAFMQQCTVTTQPHNWWNIWCVFIWWWQ